MAERREHIVMFPFLGQGHIIPFLALSLELERTKGYTITFVNTPLNIKRLRSSLPPTSSINLLEIPFNSSDHGLPPNTENTDSIPYNLVVTFLEATLSLKPSFKKIMSDLVYGGNNPPVCLISGMFFAWCAEIAHEFDIFHAIFLGGGGYGFACNYSLWMNLPHFNSNVDSNGYFTLPDFPEASKLHVTQLPDTMRQADENVRISLFARKVYSEWSKADGILLNTVAEFDRLGLMYFRRKLGRPVWPIGPALLSSGARPGKPGGITPEQCKSWLDSKPLKSVLYVSFGSMNTISAQNMMQLAMALEASGRDFIWIVRPPLGFDINSDFKAKEWLPEGFEERIKHSRKGLLVQNWAPQMDILPHDSVSAFISHCGWNSVLEALSNGVPIIGWPLAAEQFYNVKLLEEEIGVCVEVARGKTSEVRQEDIVAKIEAVMGETDKGKEMRRKVSEVKEMIKNALRCEDGFKGSSVKALDEFLEAAMQLREKSKEGGSALQD